MIRRASPADARTIAEINVLSFRAAYSEILPHDFLAGLSVAAREAAYQSRLQRDQEHAAPAWLAERDGRAIGYVSTGPPRDEDVPLPAAEIYALYVLPEAWRSGAGKALLSAAVDRWRARSSETLVLWVLEANVAGRAFYEAMGWRPDGARQEIDFGGFVRTEVRYRLELSPLA
ncbi:MAG: GNAT family N-acetyltransferase [Candidatus Limnocylindrales bacterium]